MHLVFYLQIWYNNLELRYTKVNKLTDKQKRFCEEYVLNGFNATNAYKVAYETTQKLANVNGPALLKNPKIIKEIDSLEGEYRAAGFSVGISKTRIMEKIAQMLEAKKPIVYNGEVVGQTEDYTAINNAITTFAKLTGDFAAEKKEIKIQDEEGDIDLSKLTSEEKKEYKDKLLRQLQT